MGDRSGNPCARQPFAIFDFQDDDYILMMDSDSVEIDQLLEKLVDEMPLMAFILHLIVLFRIIQPYYILYL